MSEAGAPPELTPRDISKLQSRIASIKKGIAANKARGETAKAHAPLLPLPLNQRLAYLLLVTPSTAKPTPCVFELDAASGAEVRALELSNQFCTLLRLVHALVTAPCSASSVTQ